jgi:hypothetical protein
MSIRDRSIVVTLSLCIGFGATAAWAVPITYELTGVLSKVSDPENVLGGQLSIDMPFTGSLTYDPAASPESTSGTSAQYRWDPTGTDFSLSISVGPIDAQSAPTGWSRVTVVDGYSDFDAFMAASSLVWSTGVNVAGLEIVMQDSTQTVFDGLGLPSYLDLDDFDTHDFNMLAQTGSGVALVVGNIQTLTLIPEPGTATLLLVGLIGLSRSSRRSA